MNELKKPAPDETEESQVRVKRKNFTDAQKAEVFARDKGICSFSGRSLWMIDEGISGTYPEVSIDHVIPSTLNGECTVENGVTAHMTYNKSKGINMGANIFLFYGGYPTTHFFQLHGDLPEDIALLLSSLSGMHSSDWYFNQAVIALKWGTNWLNFGAEWKLKRDADYWAGAAHRRLSEWRELTKEEKVSPMEERNLILDSPSKDQELMLSARTKKSKVEVRALMEALQPYDAASYRATRDFEKAYLRFIEGFPSAFVPVRRLLESDVWVSETAKRRIGGNIEILEAAFQEQSARRRETI